MDSKAFPKVLVQNAAYDDSLKEVVARIFQEFPMAWKEKKVLVKPNILGAHKPEAGVTTHPSLVREVVNQLQEAGARVMVGDNPGAGGYGRVETAARISGVMEAAGDCWVNLGQNPVRHPINSKYFDAVTVSRQILEADLVVNLPKLKTHGLTFITAAVKNTFGYLVGGDKMRVHAAAKTPRQFAEALLDIYRVRPPELNIMDAVMVMEGNGPSNGVTRHMGKILAGDNAVALDAVALHALGQAVEKIPVIDLAGKQGLGETDLAKIRVIGEIEPFADFVFPSTFVPGIMGVVLNRFLSRHIACTPEPVLDKCQGCGICSKHCPTGAMQMEGKIPGVNEKECISCYCCQEMCPADAIVLSGRLMKFLRGTVLKSRQA